MVLHKMLMEIILHGLLYMLLHLSETMLQMQVVVAVWVRVETAAVQVLAKWEK